MADWRVPSAPALLCDGAKLNLALVKELTSVTESQVAAACAAMPCGGPTSFVALSASIRAATATGSKPSLDWAQQRNWAMRFMGVPPPIVAFSSLLGPMPVRSCASFKAARDRTFAQRMNAWNVGSVATALAVQLSLCAADGALTSRLVHLVVAALAVAVAAPAAQRALAL